MNGALTGWDIGGANVKAARLDRPGERPIVVERAFALWREPERLAEVLADVAARLDEQARAQGADGARGPQPLRPVRAAAITMTAELADCFQDKSLGVRAVLDAAARALTGTPLHVWGTNGRFRSLEDALAAPQLVAAANWMASATWLARRYPHALLLDVGSTTTDIVPIVGGRVAATGRTDTERLLRGELVYTGVLRTPLCAIARRAPLAAGWCPLAAEHFASAADAHLRLGRIAPEAYTCETADGRGITPPEVEARLARSVCADPRELAPGDLDQLARHVVRAQRRQIVAAIRHVLGALGSDAPGRAIVVGAGERLGAEAAHRAGLEVSHLAHELGPGTALATPAAAVAELLAGELARHQHRGREAVARPGPEPARAGSRNDGVAR